MTAQISVGQMFIGGIVPGLLLASLYIGYIVVRTLLDPRLAPVGEDVAEAALAERLAALSALVLPTFIIVAVLGSIYFRDRDADGGGRGRCLRGAGVGGAGAPARRGHVRPRRLGRRPRLGDDPVDHHRRQRRSSRSFTGTGGADFLLGFIEGLDANRYVVLAAMMLVLIFLGMFLDEIGIILLCVPVLSLPVIEFLEFDLLWFGIIFLYLRPDGLHHPAVRLPRCSI